MKELGDVQGAIDFYLKAIKLKPRFCDAYNNLASTYLKKADWKSDNPESALRVRAENCFRNGVMRDP